MAFPRFAWNLIIIAGDNDEIDFDVNGVNDVVTLAPKADGYRWLGDGSADDMALALKTALETHSQGGTFTITIDDDGLVNILYSAAVVVTIYWQPGSSTATPGWFGRDPTAESFVGNVGSTGDFLAGGTWYPDIPCIDDRVIPFRLGSHSEPVTANGETTETGEWETVAFRWDWVWGIRVLQDTADQSAYATVYHPSGASGAGDPNIAFETMWDHLWKTNETYEDDGVYYYPEGGHTPEEGPYYMWGTRQGLTEHLTVVDEAGPSYRVNIWVKK